MRRKEAQLPTALRMALGVASGQAVLHESRRRIEEQKAQAELINAMARRAEFERQASTIMALKHTQAPVVLGEGGKHPAFGYEVPVGMDEGMIRMAAVEMGKGMARHEAEFRKQALSMSNKLGLGAAVGAVGLGAAGLAADKGIRTADKYVLQSRYRGQPVQQAKLGQVLVSLHGGMDKESMGWFKSLATAGRAGARRAKGAFNKTRQVGGNVFDASMQAAKAGGTRGRSAFKATRAKPGVPTPKIEAPRPGTGGYAPKSAPSQSPYRTAPARAPKTTVEADPFPASSAPKTPAPKTPTPTTPTTDPNSWGEGFKRWGNKWVVNPAKTTIKHPGWTALGAVGVPALAYGGYKATQAGIDVMSKHNPQYTYNQGGYQLPTTVSPHGYAQAPAMRY